MERREGLVSLVVGKWMDSKDVKEGDFKRVYFILFELLVIYILKLYL